MKIFMVHDSSDNFWDKLADGLVEKGNNVVVDDFRHRISLMESSREVLNEVLKERPAVVHAPVFGYQLLAVQIACGIPTVVQCNFGHSLAYDGGSPVDRVSELAFETFTIMNSFLVITDSRELVPILSQKTENVVYIRKLEGMKVNDKVSFSDGAIGIYGDFSKEEAVSISHGIKRMIRKVPLRFGASFNAYDGDDLSFIVVAPGTHIDEDDFMALCYYGVPIFAYRSSFNDVPCISYSSDLETVICHALQMKDDVYDNMRKEIVGFANKSSLEVVSSEYIDAYHKVIEAALRRLPVRGW